MKSYRSGFAEYIKNFVAYREASGVWNDVSYGVCLGLFDQFCADNYPKGAPLSQEMVDKWCAKRETELNRSRNARIRVVRAFIKYLRERGLTFVEEPVLLKAEAKSFVPHAFTEDELRRFFAACDDVPTDNSFSSKIQHLTCPVFFRLLYSSGIRTTEARLLKRIDFDQTHGVLSIRNSKGYDQHYVALHETMTALLSQYDEVISEIQPGRTFLFESPKGGNYKRTWVTDTFNTLWAKSNPSSTRATPYQLRHHYAVVNINSWNGEDGFEFSDRLLYLSKSMGHRAIASTLSYYSLVPRLADTILEKTETGFNSIVPEVYYEK